MICRKNSLLGETMEFCRRSTNSRGPINRKAMEFMRRAKMENCRHSSGSSPRVIHVQSYLHCWQSVWQPLAHAPGRGPGMTAAPETPPIAGGTATEKRLCVGSAANTRPARGIRPRVSVTRFWLPAPVLTAVMARKADHEPEMTSPYLNRPCSRSRWRSRECLRRSRRN
jgi:hypothetical protein